ncbi:hypothetical protein J2780_002266 [Chryseobacterium camelliae]|nr:hypothetical protein [Chryseobacterium camelliae]
MNKKSTLLMELQEIKNCFGKNGNSSKPEIVFLL